MKAMFVTLSLTFLLLLGWSQALSRTQPVTRSQLLSFGPGTSDSSLTRGDDKIAGIRLPLPFTFYETDYTEIFVRI